MSEALPSSDKLEDQPWFHGVLPKKEAEDLLQKNGDFLVRERGNKSERVLSIYWGKDRHYTIEKCHVSTCTWVFIKPFVFYILMTYSIVTFQEQTKSFVNNWFYYSDKEKRVRLKNERSAIYTVQVEILAKV